MRHGAPDALYSPGGDDRLRQRPWDPDFLCSGAAFLESTTANRWPVRPDAAYRPVGAARY
ncbi:hypothetical protein KPNJ1_01723 [Klebsiella pneumoniae 30660/NJST258_1]|uniref:Uncharacterized protein n=1 Tax=Klebsiella pneumoniae 30684/NJST258_2 TaxID=1420013 RepID=W8VFH5_KLEPN|nr:hypothetical protein KPNJ2_01691 [Klebsiella pneumoniae 30684/NJST258_2]AHM84129.1 hypothetical protein KPNJ1_01723 [Klebsiella pneumoniae 30660/NJST258_1]